MHYNPSHTVHDTFRDIGQNLIEAEAYLSKKYILSEGI